MALAKRFEDLDCWQLARQLTSRIYAYTLTENVGRDYAYIDQIRRASISVMNNISEGFERGSNKDFVKFMYIARGSSGEVRNMLYIGLDQGYMTQKEFHQLMDLTMRASQICYGMIRHLLTFP